MFLARPPPNLLPIIKANVNSGSYVMTDEAGQYARLRKHFTEHDFVTRGTGKHVRGDVHTNTLGGFYSVFKRGVIGAVPAPRRTASSPLRCRV
jgi:hypothetical protein